jgi:hypothetical protein
VTVTVTVRRSSQRIHRSLVCNALFFILLSAGIHGIFVSVITVTVTCKAAKLIDTSARGEQKAATSRGGLESLTFCARFGTTTLRFAVTVTPVSKICEGTFSHHAR